MFTIKKATTNDIQLINEMAQIVFPATYREILSKEQLDYMMDWMYSPKNLRKQMEEEGHIYYIAYKDGEAAGYVSIQARRRTFISSAENLCTSPFSRLPVGQSTI